MIVDLHAHYPMHLAPRARGGLPALLRSPVVSTGLRDWLRAAAIELASAVANWRTPCSGPRVRIEYLREGGVGVVLSVLYSFFDEVDVLQGARPHDAYLRTLEDQLETVEQHLADHHAAVVSVARSPAEVAATQAAGRLALVHCVEGGFHLGGEPAAVERAVERLAARGVAYVTLAHLIWRDVATDAPALPFLTDQQYRRWLPQPRTGLSELGRAAVRALAARGMIIDVAHMSELALADTFALLDGLDAKGAVPVIASHAGRRLGTQEYMLSEDTIGRIAARDGVVGLIFATHQLEDRVPGSRLRRRLPGTRSARFAQGFKLLCAHVDALKAVTGSHRHTAIGSDLDGFIKPTLPGLQDMRAMARLEAALLDRYGDVDGRAICSGNALRVLGRWRGAPSG